MKTKDVIVRRTDGLYAIEKENGMLGFTNKANATHFTGKSRAKKQLPMLEFHNVKYIDLNSRREKCQQNK